MLNNRTTFELNELGQKYNNYRWDGISKQNPQWVQPPKAGGKKLYFLNENQYMRSAWSILIRFYDNGQYKSRGNSENRGHQHGTYKAIGKARQKRQKNPIFARLL